MRDARALRDLKGPVNEVALHPAKPSGLRSHHQRSAAGEELGAGFALDLPPDPVRCGDERRMGLALGDGLPRDARLAMAGAFGMGRIVAVEADRPGAARGELIERGAAHRAQTHDENIRAARHARPFPQCAGGASSPASTRTAKTLPGGGRGQTAKSVKAQGGLTARLKSRRIVVSPTSSPNRKRAAG